MSLARFSSRVRTAVCLIYLSCLPHFSEQHIKITYKTPKGNCSDVSRGPGGAQMSPWKGSWRVFNEGPIYSRAGCVKGTGSGWRGSQGLVAVLPLGRRGRGRKFLQPSEDKSPGRGKVAQRQSEAGQYPSLPPSGLLSVLPIGCMHPGASGQSAWVMPFSTQSLTCWSTEHGREGKRMNLETEIEKAITKMYWHCLFENKSGMYMTGEN